MVGRACRLGEAGLAGLAAGYGRDMPDVPDEDEVEQEKQDQVLQREGFEEELMQQGRSDAAEEIDSVETGEENV